MHWSRDITKHVADNLHMHCIWCHSSADPYLLHNTLSQYCSIIHLSSAAGTLGVYEIVALRDFITSQFYIKNAVSNVFVLKMCALL